MTSQRARSSVAFVLALLALTGCASATPGTASSGPEQYLEEIQERLDVVDAVYLSSRVVDALPNARYLFDDGSLVTESDSVVIGRVTSVDDVRGYTLDGEKIREVTGGDTAMWHLARATVTVEEGWGAAAAMNQVAVTFPLSSANDLPSSIESIQSLGRVLLILNGGRIVHNEEYLGLIDEADTISYPFITDPSVVEGVTTVAELRAALQVTRDPISANSFGTGR